MKYISMFILCIFSSCSTLPFFVKEVGEVIESEEDYNNLKNELIEKNNHEQEKTSEKETTIQND